jgi:hypothetical protein
MKNYKLTFPTSISRTYVIIGLICIAAILSASLLFLKLFIEETATFYKNSGSWDADYLPLIEPYRAARFSDDPTSWSVDLVVGLSETKGLYYFQITDIEKIAVENKIIMIYTPYSRSLTDEEKSLSTTTEVS